MDEMVQLKAEIANLKNLSLNLALRCDQKDEEIKDLNEKLRNKTDDVSEDEANEILAKLNKVLTTEEHNTDADIISRETQERVKLIHDNKLREYRLWREQKEQEMLKYETNEIKRRAKEAQSIKEEHKKALQEENTIDPAYYALLRSLRGDSEDDM
jgi:hypothetical protein